MKGELLETPNERLISARLLAGTAMSTALSSLLVAALGAVEGVYGRSRYLGDWISYLNVSRAVSALDWRAIFDPMWNPGYPILVALLRDLFPHTPAGEWSAITLLNWLIFLFAYASWRYLIRQAVEYRRPSSMAFSDDPIIVWSCCGAFLSCVLCLDRVSSVSPDLLVTTLFVLAAAQTLSLANRPSAASATCLGMTLGLGCWTKGVFVSLSGICFFILLLLWYTKRLSWRLWLISTAVYLVTFVSYVAATSWAYGQFTLGVSGPLNYAFHVNHIPHWMNWQGGPPPFGTPLHPTRQVITDLPVFEFATPFRTTYPPFNNLAYWYQGSKSFFSPKLQIAAVFRSLYFLAAIVKNHPFLFTLTVTFSMITLKQEWRNALRTAARTYWPLILPAVLGISTYLAVHVEDRYISAFCLIFSLVPLLLLVDPTINSRRILGASLLVFYTAGAATELSVVLGPTFNAALHRYDVRLDPQWKLAAALPSYGLQSGDAVALINDGSPAYRCHWAYVSGLRIVAEFGSLPWTIGPWDRTRLDHFVAEPADENYGLLFWKKLTPARRRQVIEAFRSVGAKAVLTLSRPDVAPEPGWQEVAGTNAWIYRFDSDAVLVR